MSLKELIKRDFLLVFSGVIVVLFIAFICMTLNIASEIMDSPVNMTMAEALTNATAQGVPPILAKTFLAGVFLIIVKYTVFGSIFGFNIALFISEVSKRVEVWQEKNRRRKMATERMQRWRKNEQR